MDIENLHICAYKNLVVNPSGFGSMEDVEIIATTKLGDRTVEVRMKAAHIVFKHQIPCARCNGTGLVMGSLHSGPQACESCWGRGVV